MNRLLVLSPEAEEELLEAQHWYEARARGLGAAFLRAVDACFALVERAPEAFPVVHHELRRALPRRYPYAVFYTVSDEEVLVLACVHTGRDPGRWQDPA